MHYGLSIVLCVSRRSAPKVLYVVSENGPLRALMCFCLSQCDCTSLVVALQSKLSLIILSRIKMNLKFAVVVKYWLSSILPLFNHSDKALVFFCVIMKSSKIKILQHSNFMSCVFPEKNKEIKLILEKPFVRKSLVLS